jgi:signal transduction histidine kinase
MGDRLARMLGGRFLSIRLKFTLSMALLILAGGALLCLAAGPYLRQASLAADPADRLREFEWIMAGMVLVFTCVGTAGSLVFSNFISAPIYKILKACEEFAPGGPIPAIGFSTNDELRLLAQGFHSMMERINESDRKHKATQTKILETERLASMGTLATGLAHEINNPIAGIQMCLRRLLKTRHPDPRHNEYLLLISEATDHIKCVVQDLLAYAQESDQEKTETDLRYVVADAAKLIQPRLNRNNIQLHMLVPGFPCGIPGVKSRLVQVIVNGIINSIDAIGGSGNIWISLRKAESGYAIAVEDDGPGIAPEVAAKAFEPFFTTKGKKGTGLGLYVSFGIILAHHGRIGFRPRQAGRGTLLSVELPDGQSAGSAHAYSHSRG